MATAGDNCGANAKGGGGFQPGNTCAKGDGRSPNDGGAKFDATATNREIRQLLAADPDAKPVTVHLSADKIAHYRGLYGFYKSQDTTDARRIEAIERNPPMPPVILGGSPDDWHALDGTHRLAVAAHHGIADVPAYFFRAGMKLSAAADNCGTGAGGFRSGNRCASGGTGGGKLPKGPRKRLAKALGDLAHHGERHVRGEGGAAGKLAARNEIGLAAGELADALPAEPVITGADAKAIDRAYAIDLREYDAGGPREGMAKLAAKAGAIEHELGPSVAVVTAKGAAGKLLRKMHGRVGVVGSDVISHVKHGAGADVMADAFGGSPRVEGASGVAYRRVTSRAWVRVRDPDHAAKVLDESKVPASVKAKEKQQPARAVALSAVLPPPEPLAVIGRDLPAKVGGRPAYYRRGVAAYARDYAPFTHPGDGRPFRLSTAMLDTAVRTFKRRAAKGIRPFVTPYHVDHRADPDARDVLGYVIGLERDGEQLRAEFQLIGDDALHAAESNSRSVYLLPEAIDADGERYEQALHHIALTPYAALHGLGGLEPIAASAAAPRPLPPDAAAYTLALCACGCGGTCGHKQDTTEPAGAGATGDSPMPLTAEQKSRLAKLVPDANAIPAEPDAEFYIKLAEGAAAASPATAAARELSDKVTALSATVKTLEKERDDAKALALSSAPRQPDAVTLAMFRENIDGKREAAVRAGAVSEAEAKTIDALIAAADGTPTPLALSATPQTAGKPFAFALWDAVGKLGGNGVRAGHAVERGEPGTPPVRPALSLSGTGYADDDKGEPVKPERLAELLRSAGVYTPAAKAG